MPNTRALSTFAAIALGLAAGALGLGMAAHAAAASADASIVVPAGKTVGVALPGIQPGALALFGLSGIVAFWPGKSGSVRRRRSGTGPDEGVSVGTNPDLLANAA